MCRCKPGGGSRGLHAVRAADGSCQAASGGWGPSRRFPPPPTVIPQPWSSPPDSLHHAPSQPQVQVCLGVCACRLVHLSATQWGRGAADLPSVTAGLRYQCLCMLQERQTVRRFMQQPGKLRVARPLAACVKRIRHIDFETTFSRPGSQRSCREQGPQAEKARTTAAPAKAAAPLPTAPHQLPRLEPAATSGHSKALRSTSGSSWGATSRSGSSGAVPNSQPEGS